MNSASEQSAGILPLLALAIFVGAVAWEQAQFYEWPAYSKPSCELRGWYKGRNGDGIPEYRYFRRCYGE